MDCKKSGLNKTILNPVRLNKIGLNLVEFSLHSNVILEWLKPNRGKIPSLADDYNATFTRSTSGTYIDKGDKLFKTASVDLLREESTGYLFEPQRTNIALYSQQFDQAGTWSATNLLVIPNIVDSPDGTKNADVLVANSANATILQSVTSASADRVFSIYIEGVVITGNIELTIDNGVTWTVVPVTVGVSTRVTVTQAAVTNPTFGIRIINSGDIIAAWQADLEEGLAATSSIVTTNSSVTRTVDDLQLPVADGTNHIQAQGTYFFDWIPNYDAADVTSEFDILTISTSAHTLLSYDGTNLKSSDGTNTALFALSVVAGTTYKLGLAYSSLGNILLILVDGVIGTPANYDGAFPIETHFRLFYGADESNYIKNIEVI